MPTITTEDGTQIYCKDGDRGGVLRFQRLCPKPAVILSERETRP